MISAHLFWWPSLQRNKQQKDCQMAVIGTKGFTVSSLGMILVILLSSKLFKSILFHLLSIFPFLIKKKSTYSEFTSSFCGPVCCLFLQRIPDYIFYNVNIYLDVLFIFKRELFLGNPNNISKSHYWTWATNILLSNTHSWNLYDNHANEFGIYRVLILHSVSRVTNIILSSTNIASSIRSCWLLIRNFQAQIIEYSWVEGLSCYLL